MSPETRTVAPSSSASRPSSHTSASRFLPGDLLVGRYRIVAILGRGGMGEVYRADDLTLDQPVALKFLSRAVTGDDAAVTRFRGEVRIARQVSHPNVCRVYDLAEVDGEYFLSMEYVDGEDLGSLLRRIGRLPEDKGLDIARRLCAGLAAAHERGVLHRDLKPGNVMLDGRGQVLLTDFGLAGIAGEIGGNEVRNGTPAYMAPEQLSGKEVSVRSDIYSLGMVLHEVFTGRKPEETKTPSSFVRDLDPAIDRVIMRCLERDPINRPKTALSVAAALPGGDPLAAALAAGETPSPQMVAAAGEGAGLSVAAGLAWVAGILAALAIIAVFTSKFSFLALLNPPYSPEILRQKARDLITDNGYLKPPGDSAHGFDWDTRFINFAEQQDGKKVDWAKVSQQRPSVLNYWYRQAGSALTGEGFKDDKLTPGIVSEWDPPATDSGMVSVVLDPQGRLVNFEAIPNQRTKPQHFQASYDWAKLFRAAQLDIAQFQETPPEWTFLAASDSRKAWTGKFPGSSRPLRIEAASFEGLPVEFSLIGPWKKAERMPEEATGWNLSGGLIGTILLVMAVLIMAVFFARRNLLRGSGDREGAFRIAVFLFLVQFSLWLCRGHLTLSGGTAGMAFLAVCTSIFFGALVWAMYLAFEPQVRRRWPRTLIGSTAVLAGKWRDPVVGRDALYGIAMAMSWNLIGFPMHLALSRTAPQPDTVSQSLLLGPRLAAAAWLLHVPGAIRETLILFLFLFLLRSLFKREWLASGIFVVIFTLLQIGQSTSPLIDGVIAACIYLMIAAIVFRAGIFALSMCILVVGLISNVPTSFQPADWYFWNGWFMYGSVAVMTIAAFRIATANHPIWEKNWFD